MFWPNWVQSSSMIGKLLIKASRGEDYQEKLDFTVSHFGDDIVPSSLEIHLEILNSAFADMTPTLLRSRHTYDVLQLSDAQCVSVSKVCTVLKLIIYFLAVDAGIRQKMCSQNSIILHTADLSRNRVTHGFRLNHTVTRQVVSIHSILHGSTCCRSSGPYPMHVRTPIIIKIKVKIIINGRGEPWKG